MSVNMSDVELLTRAGEALWGERWQAPMARFAKVQRQTVQDWKRGHSRIPPGIYAELAAEISKRIEELRTVKRTLLDRK